MIFLNEIETSIRKAVSVNYDSVKCYIVLRGRYGIVVAVLVDAYSRVIDGYHEFPGAEELVRAYMLKNDKSVLTPQVIYHYYLEGSEISSPDTLDLGIIFTGAQLRAHDTFSANVFASKYFLTHYKIGWTLSGRYFTLNYCAASDEIYTVVRTYKDGTTASYVGTAPSDESSFLVYPDTDCVSAVVTMGSRTFTIYYLDMEVYERLMFRNAFNALEVIYIPAATNISPKTEFETAQQDNVLQRYDIEEQLEVEIKTPPLPEFMRLALLDLCRSHHVEHYDPYRDDSNINYASAYSPVIIKKYKFEKSNEPNNPLVLELTLQYCDTKRNSAIDFG